MADEKAGERTIQLEFDFSDIDAAYDEMHAECWASKECKHHVCAHLDNTVRAELIQQALALFLKSQGAFEALRGELMESRMDLLSLTASAFIQGAMYGRHKVLTHQLEAIGRLSGEPTTGESES